MKKIAVIKYIFLLLLVISCKKENTQLETKKAIENKDFNNLDEDFNAFLLKFNQDSIFQMSRINFPLKVKEADSDNDYKTIERVINKKDFAKLDFTLPKDAQTREFDKFTQKIKLTKNNATIEVRGIDNGIHSDVIFEKVNGKWNLKTWIDEST